MKIRVNGTDQYVDAAQDVPLLYVLRNHLSMVAPKYGCGQGICGACAVLVNGRPVRSCVVALGAVKNAEVTTLHGLSTDPVLRAIQNAFVHEQAAQCGYCSNGMIITAKALLDTNPSPTRAQICAALDANLCRCGAHLRIIRAVERAARELQQ
jgi:nicotinate dehydrogenase subunit A